MRPLNRSLVSDMIKILAGTESLDFGKRLAKAYGSELIDSKTTRFSDGEFAVSIEETVRGKVVVIVQSTSPPSDNLFELLLLIDAAKRASAKRIIAVMPYYGMARQDRKDKPRVAIGAKLVANMLMAAGVDRVITMDLHADQIQGFFEVPVDHLFGSTIFLKHIKDHLDISNICIATPDTGGTKRANSYAQRLGVDMAICYKQRKVANEVADVGILFPSRDDGAILPRQSKSKTEKEETRAEKVATLAGIIYYYACKKTYWRN